MVLPNDRRADHPMFNPNDEMSYLLELMPASGRMYCKLLEAPRQSSVITAPLPRPWQQTRPIAINFDLWMQLPRPQRDLLLLQSVNRMNQVQWLKPNLYQGVAIAGLVGAVWEFSQGNALGALVAGGVTAFAGNQIWRSQTSDQRQLEADAAAIQIAQWRGYSPTEAADHLRRAIEAVARLEQRSLDVAELMRCRRLRAIAQPSPLGVPDAVSEP